MSKPQMYRVRKGENEMLVSEFTLNKRAQKEGFVVIAEVFYRPDGSTDEVAVQGHEKTVNDASKIGFVPEEIANLRAKKAETETAGEVDPNQLPGDFSGVKIHEGNPVETVEPKSVTVPTQPASADVDPNKVDSKVTEPAKGYEKTPAAAPAVKPKNKSN